MVLSPATPYTIVWHYHVNLTFNERYANTPKIYIWFLGWYNIYGILMDEWNHIGFSWGLLGDPSFISLFLDNFFIGKIKYRSIFLSLYWYPFNYKVKRSTDPFPRYTYLVGTKLYPRLCTSKQYGIFERFLQLNNIVHTFF